MINAQIPTSTVVNSPVVLNEDADAQIPRVLFMAMDAITDAEKYELPFKGFGGIHLPHIPGLRESKYMLYRCLFTQLPAFTPVGDWDMMVPPEMRTHLARSFSQTVNGQLKTVQGFLESDMRSIKEDGVFKNKRSNHLVFHKRYPGHDARKATQRTAPHGIGGTVEVTALKGASLEEIQEAQMFFFPQWDEIKTGLAELPKTAKEMEAHIHARRADIVSLPPSLQAKYQSIAQDMLKSVAEFQRHGLNTIKGDEVIYKAAFDKGETGVRNSDASELLLAQTGTRRKSDLLSGDDSAVNRLADIIAKKELGNDEASMKALLLEERKQYTAEIVAGLRERDTEEEIRLGMRKAAEAPVNEPKIYHSPLEKALDTIPADQWVTEADTIDGSTAVRTCGAVKANGEACKRELKDGETACFQHNQ